MGAAYIAHKSWFIKFNPESWQQIVVASVIAVASGNIWFSVNRYGIHEFRPPGND
jgi:hypothetical protein